MREARISDHINLSNVFFLYIYLLQLNVFYQMFNIGIYFVCINLHILTLNAEKGVICKVCIQYFKILHVPY